MKEVPTEWRNSIILTIHKKGDTRPCDNYRGISLLSIAAKVYESLIEKRLRVIIEPKLRDKQRGFRKERGINDHIFRLQTKP